MYEVTQDFPGGERCLAVPWVWFIDCVGKLDQSHSSNIFSFLSLVPEPVKDLKLLNRSTENLHVTWSLANGDVDQYEVQLLFNDMKVFPPIHLVNTATEYQFTALIPGRHYKILVLTISGDVQQSAFIEGLTGNLKYCSWAWVGTVMYLRYQIMQVFRLSLR